MVWYNNDGLLVNFPSDSRINKGGEFCCSDGPYRTIELEFDGSALTTSNAILDNYVIVPRNFRIEQIELVSETAFTNLTSVDLGLIRVDRSTELDYDGLVAAIPLASINADSEKNTLNVGSTYAGALVGTTLTYPGYITGKRVGTAGVGHGVLRIRGYVPAQEADTNEQVF